MTRSSDGDSKQPDRQPLTGLARYHPFPLHLRRLFSEYNNGRMEQLARSALVRWRLVNATDACGLDAATGHAGLARRLWETRRLGFFRCRDRRVIARLELPWKDFVDGYGPASRARRAT
jgi:hypothetical protein